MVKEAKKAIRKQEQIKRDGCPWVFPAPSTNEKPALFDEPFREARFKAELDAPDARDEPLVMHSLRHSAATEAGKGGATAFEICLKAT